MQPSEDQDLQEKAFSVLPNIKKMEPAPPSGPKPKHLSRGTERKLSRARQANPRRLPTVQGDDGSKTNNAVFYSLRFGEGASNLFTELIPPKIETPPILPAIKKSGELVAVSRGKSSEDLEVCEPKPPVTTNQQPSFRRKFKPSKQPIESNHKPAPPKPKPPTAPSKDSPKSGNFRRRMYKLY